jgi:hypothetical protein
MADTGLLIFTVDQDVIIKYKDKMMQKGLKYFFMRFWKLEGALKTPKGIINKL